MVIKLCGIYKIKNLVTDKYYLGSSHNIESRIKKHFQLLKRNKHHSIYLQNAYNKYGRNSFKYEILEKCTKDELLILEQKYLDNIKLWGNSYNISKIASGCSYDLSAHPNEKEIRKKISKSSRGRNTKPFYIKEKRYKKLLDAANELGVDIKTISNRIKRWENKNYYYCGKHKNCEYNETIHSDYLKKEIKDKKKQKKIYYCGCGSKIDKRSKNCKSCAGKISHVERHIIVNGEKYKSTKNCSLILNIKYPTLLSRIKSNTLKFKDYYYVNNPKDVNNLMTPKEIGKKISSKLKNKPSPKRSFHIYNIYFNSILNASKILKKSKGTIMKNLKDKNNSQFIYLN